MGEGLGLPEPVLPRRRIDHEEAPIVGSIGLRRDDLVDFAELFDQIGPRMHPARGIGEDEAGPLGPGRVHGIPQHGSRVRARLLRDDPNPEPLGHGSSVGRSPRP